MSAIIQVDYPGLKLARVVVSAREVNRADNGDVYAQEMLCDRYAREIGREGLLINWHVMRANTVLIYATVGDVGSFMRRLKKAIARVATPSK